MMLRGEPLFARCLGRFRRAPFTLDHERLPDDARQSLHCGLAVLGLAPAVAGDDTHHSFRIEARRQLPEQARPYLLAHRARVREVPEELDPGGRRIDVLPTGATRA